MQNSTKKRKTNTILVFASLTLQMEQHQRDFYIEVTFMLTFLLLSEYSFA